MPAKILDGKKLSDEILCGLEKQVEKLKKHGINPCLAVVLVGNNPDSELYVRKKQEACKKIGVESKKISLSSGVSEKQLLEEIEKLNSDEKVHGILVQLPLPKHINQEKILDSISPLKDVDGFSPENIGKLAHGIEELVSCTPKGIIRLIESTGVQIEGKNACIINHSVVVGKPLALLMLNRNATVTICHKFTKNIKGCIAGADIVVSAVGRKNLFSGDSLKEGAIVIDAGIFCEGKKVFGDFDFESARQKASWITPVPGGVGPMTVACLLENTLIACRLQAGL